MTVRHALTILAVADLARAASFYERAFRFARVVDAPVYVELAIEPGRGLGLYAVDGFARTTGAPAAPSPSATTTRTELYFLVDDLDDAIARLHAAGARALSPRAPRDWGDEAAYFADPDGNVVVVAARA